jgi:hypothetical protein
MKVISFDSSLLTTEILPDTSSSTFRSTVRTVVCPAERLKVSAVAFAVAVMQDNMPSNRSKVKPLVLASVIMRAQSKSWFTAIFKKRL